MKMSKVDPVHIMLMENTLRLKDPQKLKYIFDLKGSTVDRKVKGKTKSKTTLKDINFLIAQTHKPDLATQTNQAKRLLRSVLAKDLKFLQSQGLMDYSLLLGIEQLDQRPVSQALFHQMGASRHSQ